VQLDQSNITVYAPSTFNRGAVSAIEMLTAECLSILTRCSLSAKPSRVTTKSVSGLTP
jgi:hypothetical protein